MPEEVLRRDLARMMRAVDFPAFEYLRPTTVDAPLAVGNIITGVENALVQPARDDARGLWLMLDGEVLNAAELARELRRLRVEPVSDDDAHLALAAFTAFGPRFVEHLNGRWNLVIFDRGTRETWLVRDRLGSRLLYVAEDAGRFVFASEMKGVIAGRKTPTRPGGIGFLQLLVGSHLLGDQTWLEGIRALPPGTMTRISPRGSRETHRYFRLHFREGGPETSEASYAEGFARHLVAATERALRHHEGHPVGITLSGGLDSRSVALAIPKSSLPITSLTYGAAESPDVIYAGQLAEVIGLSHQHIEPLWPQLVEASSATLDRLVGPNATGQARGFYSAQLDRVVWRSEALAALHGVSSTIWHPLYRRAMRIMLNGACGDAMTGSHLTPSLLLAPTRRALVADAFRRWQVHSRELVEPLLAPDFARRAFSALEPSFASTFAQIDADEAMAISNVWDMENRQGRGTFSAFAIEQYFCTCRSPYLDYALVEHLASVPGRWRFQQRVYKRMLVDHFPEAAHVPWAYTRGRITKSPTFEFAREAANYLKRRALERLPSRRGASPHWLFRDETPILQADFELADVVRTFARSESFPSDVLHREGVLAFVERFLGSERPGELAFVYAHLVGIARASALFLEPSEITVPTTADPACFGVDPRAL